MAAALALVGCSKSELVDTPVQDQNAIAFGTYVGDNAQTRASIVTTETLGVDGFGVNAYYTGTTPFADGAELNFMQNTKVTYNKDNQKWEYSPVKYWPNNTFVNDKGETQYEMVSFFAYGPYAKGGEANNIKLDGTSLEFVVANEVKDQVDLIYNTNYDGTINQTKPSVEELIHFQFGHALSRISFTVEAAVDEVVNGNNLLDGNTRINVKKVALVSDKYDAAATSQAGPFYTGGTLSLLEADKDNPWISTTLEDTQKGQGFVFNATDHFYHTVKDVNAEDMEGSKIDVVQLTRFNASEPQRLLNEDSYLMVIPQEDAEFKIYIEYDVISGGYVNGTGEGTGVYDESAIANKITKAITKPITFEKGKAYNFNLVLGMTSVKLDADVDEWDEEIDGDDEWLPENEEPTDPNKTVTYTASEMLDFTNSKAFGGNEVVSHTFENGVGTIICKDDITKIAFPDSSFVGFGDASNPEVVESITLPGTLKEIGRFAFCGMNFTSINIPEGVTSIGEGAFVACEGLLTIVIPDSVTEIGAQAFAHCTTLQSVSLPNNTNYNTLGTNMFWDCVALKEITLPENICILGYGALNNDLSTLVIENDKEVITLDAAHIGSIFRYEQVDIPKIKTYIYVPDNMVESYKNDKLWSQIKDQIKGISEKQ